MDDAKAEAQKRCGENGPPHWRVGGFLLASLCGQNSPRYLQAVEISQCQLRASGRELMTAFGLGHAGPLVAVISKVLPRLRLMFACKVLDAWRVRAPPRQAPTFPPGLANAIVTWLLAAGEAECACATLRRRSGVGRTASPRTASGPSSLATRGVAWGKKWGCGILGSWLGCAKTAVVVKVATTISCAP